MSKRRPKVKRIKLVKEKIIFDNSLTEMHVCNYDILYSNYEDEFPFKTHPICTKIKKQMYKDKMSYSDLLDAISEIISTENSENKKDVSKEIDSLAEENLRNAIHMNNVNSKHIYYMLKALGLDEAELCMEDYFAEYIFEKKITELGLSNKNNLSNEEKELFVSIHDSIINDKDSLEDLMRKAGYYFELVHDEDDYAIMKLPRSIEQELIEMFSDDRDYLDQMLRGYRMRKEAVEKSRK